MSIQPCFKIYSQYNPCSLLFYMEQFCILGSDALLHDHYTIQNIYMETVLGTGHFRSLLHRTLCLRQSAMRQVASGNPSGNHSHCNDKDEILLTALRIVTSYVLNNINSLSKIFVTHYFNSFLMMSRSSFFTTIFPLTSMHFRLHSGQKSNSSSL